MSTIHELVASKIQRDPTLIRRAYDTLQHWESSALCPAGRCQEWRALLDQAVKGAEGVQAILTILRSATDSARRMQDFSPFAGLLSREERRKAFLACTYDH